MTAIEIKASLVDSIQRINDVTLIERISRYVRNAVSEANRDRITPTDLVIDPEVENIVKGLKNGPAIDDKVAIHQHWEEKYS